MAAHMISREQTAHLLIAISLVGFATMGIRMLWHDASDAVSSGDSLIQTGVLILSILLMATGSYLTGYRKGRKVTNRITLDFSKKMDSSTKSSAQ